jgi:hypothetical protein
MRMLAQQLRTETADLFEISLARNAVDLRIARENRKLSSLLARLRTASDCATIAPGEYASKKFDRVSSVFSISEVVDAAQQNLELSNSHLAHVESMNLERSQAALNAGVGIFAAITLALAIPSFWNDTIDIFDESKDLTDPLFPCIGEGCGKVNLLTHFPFSHASDVIQWVTLIAAVGILFCIPALLVVHRRDIARSFERRTQMAESLLGSHIQEFRETRDARKIAEDQQGKLHCLSYSLLRKILNGPASEHPVREAPREATQQLTIDRREDDCARTGYPVLILTWGDEQLSVRVFDSSESFAGSAEAFARKNLRTKIPEDIYCADRAGDADDPFEPRTFSPRLNRELNDTLIEWLRERPSNPSP